MMAQLHHAAASRGPHFMPGHVALTRADRHRQPFSEPIIRPFTK